MIRGKIREIGVETPEKLKIEMSIHNRFDVEVTDITTGEVTHVAHAENIILDQYWNAVFTEGSRTTGSIIHFGSGVGSISPDRTSLFSEVGYKVIQFSDFAVENDRISKLSIFTGKIEILPAEYVGVEFTEIGLGGWGYRGAPSGRFLSTHALFKDANNNPITIVKKSTDLLTIKASVYMYYPGLDMKNIYFAPSIPVVYENSTNNRSVLPIPRTILGIGGSPNNTYISVASALSPYHKSVSTFAFDLANKKIIFKPHRFEVNQVNDVFIERISSSYQNVFSYDLPEELHSRVSDEVLGIGDGVKTEFSTYFPFPKDVEVKINGVIVTDYISKQIYGTRFPTAITSSFIKEIYSNGDKRSLLQDSGAPMITNSNMFGGGERIFKNYHPQQKIRQIHTRSASDAIFATRLFMSNDLESWVDLGTARIIDIPEEYQNHQYIKFIQEGTGNVAVGRYAFFDRTDNIIFNTPPPEGAVIEVSYTTPGIAKDENHVLDIEVEVSFGEHEE